MALPSLEQYRKAAAKWNRTYLGVNYELSHHGVSDYQPQGTWCFYIFIQENMFLNDEDFKLFDCEGQIKDTLGSGSFWETYDYYKVPDYGFHCGITWYSKDSFIDKETGNRLASLKIGCDYSHLWDQEGGYWQGLDDVEADVKKLIEELVRNHPLKWRCAYSGKLGKPEDFYIAANDATIHNSHIEKLKENGWEQWLPKEAA